MVLALPDLALAPQCASLSVAGPRALFCDDAPAEMLLLSYLCKSVDDTAYSSIAMLDTRITLAER